MPIDNKVVADFWSQSDPSRSNKNFYAFPPLRKRACQLIFDEDDKGDPDWCEYWTIQKYLKRFLPFKTCLSVCCGFGSVERTLAQYKVAKNIIGTDIASGAIEEARKRAEKEGYTNIQYFVQDLNTALLPKGRYDLIWANGALHHLTDINIVVKKLYRALKPGGWLISNEYVGPDYQQLSLRQQEMINALKHLLPKDLRQIIVHLPGTDFPINFSVYSHSFTTLAKKIYQYFLFRDPEFGRIWSMPSKQYYLRIDPSECVRSSQILPCLKQTFDTVEVKGYGGSLLAHVLDASFFDRYQPNNTTHQIYLQMLFDIEDAMIAAQEIGHDNAHIICRKKS